MRPATDLDIMTWLRGLPPEGQALAQRWPPQARVRALVDIGPRLPRHRRIPAGEVAMVLSYGPADERFPDGVLYVVTTLELAREPTPARPDQVELIGVWEPCTDMPGGRDTMWVAHALAGES